MNRAREHRMDAVISEQADRIEALEGLVVDLVSRCRAAEAAADVDVLDARFMERIRALGIEVE